MPRKRAKTAGVGAKGEVLKRFVHPKSDRKRIWPVDDKLRLTDVEVVGKSEKRVSNKIQKVYDIKVPAHPDVAFHVVCCHFSVTVAAETPFADEVADEVPAVPAAGARGGGGGRGGRMMMPGDLVKISVTLTCSVDRMRKTLQPCGPAGSWWTTKTLTKRMSRLPPPDQSRELGGGRRSAQGAPAQASST